MWSENNLVGSAIDTNYASGNHCERQIMWSENDLVRFAIDISHATNEGTDMRMGLCSCDLLDDNGTMFSSRDRYVFSKNWIQIILQVGIKSTRLHVERK